MKAAVILTHGVPPSRETLARALHGASCFVCADGAADHARAYGFEPDAIVGDMDSVTAETLAHFTKARVVRNTDTETTDTEKAIEYVLGQGAFDQITLLGASADRLDHVVGHFSLLLRYADRIRIVLEDDRSKAWVGTGTVDLDEPVGTVVSFFALGSPAEGVTTQGFRYALNGARLELGSRDSISNVVTVRPARVRMERGRLLFFVVRVP